MPLHSCGDDLLITKTQRLFCSHVFLLLLLRAEEVHVKTENNTRLVEIYIIYTAEQCKLNSLHFYNLLLLLKFIVLEEKASEIEMERRKDRLCVLSLM